LKGIGANLNYIFANSSSSFRSSDILMRSAVSESAELADEAEENPPALM